MEIKGSDSGDFLHRVTAGKVKGIAPGTGSAGLLLTGQSQVMAQFDLLHLELGHYYLVAPAFCAEALATGLETLHFSEKLEVSLLPRKAGAHKVASAARGDTFGFTREGSELRWAAPVSGYEFTTALSGFPPEWEFQRIGELVPWPPFDWDNTCKALEAGMLPWIDRHKGCYPGQEVVELSLNVGHPARILIAVATNANLAPGGSIPWGDATAKVTSVAVEAGECRALVRVPWAKKDFMPPGFRLLRSHW